MRRLLVVAALVVMSAPALAQQRPPASNRPAPAPAPQAQQQQQQQQAPLPGMFPCRTQNEVCHVIVAASGTQGTLLYSNAPSADGAEGKPVNVQGVDLAQNVGKVVMLTGNFANGTISNAQIVEVAGPLLSFAIKLQMSGGGDEEEEETPPPQQQRGNPPAQRGNAPPQRR
jgi:hypothetical protein